MKKLAIALGLVLIQSLAFAQDTAKVMPYFVSAILKQGGPEVTMQIVQGMIISDSASNAQLVFTILATKQFPNSTVVNVLASSFDQLYKAQPKVGDVQPPKPVLPAVTL